MTVSTAKLSPTFLSNDSGQPAWAVLPYEQYQQLLALAGIQPTAEAVVGTPNTSEPEVPASATSKLLASLVESAQQADSLSGLKFDAKKLQARRAAASLSVDDLARSAGISPSYTAMIEQGEREPSAPILASFARALGIKADQLMG